LYYNIKSKILPGTGHEGTERSRGIALLFFNVGNSCGFNGQRHASAALPPGMTR